MEAYDLSVDRDTEPVETVRDVLERDIRCALKSLLAEYEISDLGEQRGKLRVFLVEKAGLSSLVTELADTVCKTLDVSPGEQYSSY